MSSPRSYTPPCNQPAAAAWEREAEVRTDGALRYAVCPASAFRYVDDAFFAFYDWARVKLGGAVSFSESEGVFYLYPVAGVAVALSDILAAAEIDGPRRSEREGREGFNESVEG